jgi:hypothetical protein
MIILPAEYLLSAATLAARVAGMHIVGFCT